MEKLLELKQHQNVVHIEYLALYQQFIDWSLREGAWSFSYLVEDKSEKGAESSP